MCRIFASLVALICLTAFAPAPLPRPKRTAQSEEISLQTMRGTWRVTAAVRTSQNGQHTPHVWAVTHVRIEGDSWTFLRGNQVSTTHALAIDGSKKPAHLDFNRDGGGGAGKGGKPGVRSPGNGIIRRKGNVVEIIYVFGGRERAVSFEQPPEGQYLLTLQRE